MSWILTRKILREALKRRDVASSGRISASSAAKNVVI